jgi:hypothetical protein
LFSEESTRALRTAIDFSTISRRNEREFHDDVPRVARVPNPSPNGNASMTS